MTKPMQTMTMPPTAEKTMTRPLRFILATTGAALAASPAFADLNGAYYGDHMGWGGWFLGPVMMVLVLALVAGVIALFLRLFGVIGPVNRSNRINAALDLLDARFARGEIDDEEYARRKKALLD